MSVQARASQSDTSPWRAEDLIRWCATTTFAVVLVGVGYEEAKVQKLFHHQFGWASVAILGAIVALYGEVAWVLRGRRAVGERLLRVLDHFDQEDIVALSGSFQGTSGQVLVSLVDGTLFHLASCEFVRGKAFVEDELLVHEARSRKPCRMCLS